MPWLLLKSSPAMFRSQCPGSWARRAEISTFSHKTCQKKDLHALQVCDKARVTSILSNAEGPKHGSTWSYWGRGLVFSIGTASKYEMILRRISGGRRRAVHVVVAEGAPRCVSFRWTDALPNGPSLLFFLRGGAIVLRSWRRANEARRCGGGYAESRDVSAFSEIRLEGGGQTRYDDEPPTNPSR